MWVGGRGYVGGAQSSGDSGGGLDASLAFDKPAMEGGLTDLRHSRFDLRRCKKEPPFRHVLDMIMDMSCRAQARRLA